MKGIKKHKKERMVYDKNADEWRPRWGYKRAGSDPMDGWLTEDKQLSSVYQCSFIRLSSPCLSLTYKVYSLNKEEVECMRLY